MVSAQHISLDFPIEREVLPVLRDISFTVPDHQVVGIVGPSGCGKSSLMRVIGGLLQPTSGSVQLGGLTPDAARAQKYIGFAFQEPVLLPWLSVSGNITLPDEIGSSAANTHQEDLTDLLNLVGLDMFRSYLPDQLSGGMKQRVALARALYTKPKVLLLDEPFGALDLWLRTKLMIDVANILRSHKTTALMVTHDVTEAIMICDKVYVFSSRPGRIVREVNVAFNEPRNMDLLRDRLFRASVEELQDALMQQL